MNQIELLQEIVKETPSKIVYLIMDGLGGLPTETSELTELEVAKTPNLNKLAYNSSLGLSIPVFPGITPGSGPGHLGLFGYNPMEYLIGRGALSAAGVGFKQGKEDLAARINFCTVDAKGDVTDRRAGRIPTELCIKLSKKLSGIKIKGAEIFVLPEREHRAVVIFRAKGLSDKLSDTDPQKIGVPPKKVTALDAKSKKAATLVAEFIKKASQVLKNDHPANMILLRGFAKKPALPQFPEIYKLKPLAIAVYPMYKGLAHLAGMTVLDGLLTIDEQIEALKKNWNNYTFFFIHYKYTDSTGEDGNFSEKIKKIEIVDSFIPEIMKLNPDCLIVTGDHSTPSALKTHSWHGVPFMISSKFARRDKATKFSESDCAKGSLGAFEAKYTLSLALAHAGKLDKFGA